MSTVTFYIFVTFKYLPLKSDRTDGQKYIVRGKTPNLNYVLPVTEVNF